MTGLIQTLLALLLIASACAPPQVSPPSTPVAPPLGASRSPRQAQIVEPRAAPGSFPRVVRDSTGEVTIPAKPRRIHTLSVGYDEITFRLVDLSRIAAIGNVTVNAEFSNVATEAAQVPGRVGRDAEQILALGPDLVVASPFASPDLLKQLRDARVPLVVADLVSSIDAQAENIRFLAYLYGEEERGEALVSETSQRIERLNAMVQRIPSERRPSLVVLAGGQSITAAGSGTTEDGVIRLAGARNAAGESGVSGNRDISLEALDQFKPDFIVVMEGNLERPVLLPRLRQHPALSTMPAFRENRVLVMKASLLSTLSHWNVEGAEQLNRILYPGGQP